LQDRGFAHYLAEFDGGAYAEAFLAGLDPHWATAQALGFVAPETPRDKESRLHGVLREGCKGWRYGFLFGMSGKRAGSIIYNTIKAAMRTTNSHCTLMYEFFGTDTPSAAVIEAAGAKAINKFIDATPGLRELRQRLKTQVDKHHWILGLDGRRVPVDSAHKALNFAVASTEAIICKRWLVKVHNELAHRFAYGWDGDVVLVGWIHDELVACCRPEVADLVGEVMVRWAKEPGEHYGFRCALDADYKIGRSWAGDVVLPPAPEPPLVAFEPPAIPAQPNFEGVIVAAEVESAATEPPATPAQPEPPPVIPEPPLVASELSAVPEPPEPPAATEPLNPSATPVQPDPSEPPSVTSELSAASEPPEPPAAPEPPDPESTTTTAAEVVQPTTTAMGNGAAADPWWCEPIAIEGMYRISPVVEDTPSPVTCLDAALQWAGRGCSVFPAPPGAKKSYKAGKQNGGPRWGATSDPAEIERDWGCWPNANVGLPTDAANGFFVLEADTREGHPKLGDQDGLATLAALECEFGPLPSTLQAESPSGSQHRYFRHPAGAPVRSKAGWRHGVDIKGEGGMVLAPPSRRGDKAYRWVNQLPIAEPPQWLLELIQDGREHAPKDTNGFSDELLEEMAADAEQGVWEEEETPAEKLRLALAVIPPTSREERINFGRALYRWSDGSEEGFSLFTEWLRLRDGNGKLLWPDCIKANARQVWRKFKEVKPPEQIVTIASIFGRANELDLTWWDRWTEGEYAALGACPDSRGGDV
jgi:hypothetical protein